MDITSLLTGVDVLAVEGPLDRKVASVVSHSGEASPGACFVAIRGTTADGHSFIPEAVQKGAVLVLAEGSVPSQALHPPGSAGATLAVVANTRRALALVARNFFGDPSRQLALIGVTGTNGKTTTTLLTESILRVAGIRTGLVGTLFYRFGDEEVSALHTTPEAPVLQGALARMVKEGVTHCIMEVSSHALVLDRTVGCTFEASVFTSFSQDHLDFHLSLEDYFQAKTKLFYEYTFRAAILNADDPWFARLLDEGRQKLLTYGLAGTPDIKAHDLELSVRGTRFTVATPAGTLRVESPLIGRHNIYNMLAAVGVGLHVGVEPAAIQEGLEVCRAIPGRFERVEAGQDFAVVVDYAHTDDALRNALEAARSLGPARLLTVFGCGGDRDALKRPKMGAVAARLSDEVIVTSDNPRTEDPTAIIDQILAGIAEVPGGPERTAVVPDRQEAIAEAVGRAHSGDFVLIAGKGHETYQIVGMERRPFDDRLVARRALEARLGQRAVP
ncbi:MAG: UDP-N-acetylmuramoyl-L-alanyl-D-glutamate--2,6-diaminopimelate ligase [Candidatus Tectimicrobiota bacterium]